MILMVDANDVCKAMDTEMFGGPYVIVLGVENPWNNAFRVHGAVIWMMEWNGIVVASSSRWVAVGAVDLGTQPQMAGRSKKL